MSDETRSGPKSELQGKDYKLACLYCDVQTTHRVVFSAEYRSHFEDPCPITCWDDYQIVECLGCQSVSFRHGGRDTENADYDPQTRTAFLVEEVKLYPPRKAGRSNLDDWHLLPSQISLIYNETLTALRSNLPILAGIGIRALIETVCKDRKATGKSLEARIDALVEQRILTPDGAAILHSLRTMGNEAAHEVKPHSAEVLNIAFDVIEYVLKGVYILPERVKKLPARGAT